jgi:hypothetical protein
MKSIIERIQKRRKFPVLLDNGETLHVRPLGHWERGELKTLEGSDQLVFTIGSCLVDENSGRVFERRKDEPLNEFIERVRETTTDLTSEDVDALVSAVSKVTQTPPAETALKKFDATDTPGS